MDYPEYQHLEVGRWGKKIEDTPIQAYILSSDYHLSAGWSQVTSLLLLCSIIYII